jgi:hypothetical protein
MINRLFEVQESQEREWMMRGGVEVTKINYENKLNTTRLDICTAADAKLRPGLACRNLIGANVSTEGLGNESGEGRREWVWKTEHSVVDETLASNFRQHKNAKDRASGLKSSRTLTAELPVPAGIEETKWRSRIGGEEAKRKKWEGWQISIRIDVGKGRGEKNAEETKSSVVDETLASNFRQHKNAKDRTCGLKSSRTLTAELPDTSRDRRNKDKRSDGVTRQTWMSAEWDNTNTSVRTISDQNLFQKI